MFSPPSKRIGRPINRIEKRYRAILDRVLGAEMDRVRAAESQSVTASISTTPSSSQTASYRKYGADGSPHRLQDPNQSQIHRARRYSLSLRRDNDCGLTQNDEELLGILDDLERDDSVKQSVCADGTSLNLTEVDADLITALLYAFCLSVFDALRSAKNALLSFKRALDEDGGSDSAASKWTDSESEDDDVVDGLSTLRLSRSVRPSPAKKERKIEIEIDDILYVHSLSISLSTKWRNKIDSVLGAQIIADHVWWRWR